MLTICCCGCHGDAVKDAPAADRLPEFVLCVQVGLVVCSVTYALLPPMVFTWVIEYPLALGACLILRALPWRSAAQE